MFTGKQSVLHSHAHKEQERTSVPFLMEQTCCYYPGRGGKKPCRGWPAVTYTASSVCQPLPQNVEIMHAVMNSRKKQSMRSYVGWFTSSLMAGQSSQFPGGSGDCWAVYLVPQPFSAKRSLIVFTSTNNSFSTHTIHSPERDMRSKNKGLNLACHWQEAIAKDCGVKPTHLSSSHTTATQRQILDNAHYVTRAQWKQIWKIQESWTRGWV